MKTMMTTTTTTTTKSSAEIPIWVCGQQLWISGVDRRTTVNQVVEILLGRADKHYYITEKWRRVERPLNGDTRVLKLWKTWGDAKAEVKLSLKKVDDEERPGNDSTMAAVNAPKKKYRRCKSAPTKCGQTIHPKRLAQLSDTHGGIQRLLKLILVQGETIQNQIFKLKQRQLQIEQLESEQYKDRIDAPGTNHLVNTYYLEMNEERDDSGVTTECVASSENNGTPDEKQRSTSNTEHPSDHHHHECKSDHSNDYAAEDYEHEETKMVVSDEENNDSDEITIEQDLDSEIEALHDKIHFMDKIIKINKRLEKEEENLVRLFINIERCKKKDCLTNELRCDVKKLRSENEKSQTEFENNRKLLDNVERTLKCRKFYLKRLLYDVYDDQVNVRVRSVTQRTGSTSSVLRTLPHCACVESANKPVLNTLV